MRDRTRFARHAIVLFAIGLPLTAQSAAGCVRLGVAAHQASPESAFSLALVGVVVGMIVVALGMVFALVALVQRAERRRADRG